MAEFAKHSIRFLLMKLYKIEGGAAIVQLIHLVHGPITVKHLN